MFLADNAEGPEETRIMWWPPVPEHTEADEWTTANL